MVVRVDLTGDMSANGVAEFQPLRNSEVQD